MPVGLVKLRKQNSEPKQTHKDNRIFRVGSEKQKQKPIMVALRAGAIDHVAVSHLTCRRCFRNSFVTDRPAGILQ